MQQSEDPSLLKLLKGHKQSIIALDLHPKCRYAASAGLDSSFFVWDLRDKAAPRKYEGHKGQVLDLKFHPNGSLIASSSSDGAIKFWQNENENKEVTITKAHNSKIRTIGYSCDGNLLVSAGDDKLIKIWSTLDRRLQAQYKKHENWVRSCQFSPIAKSLISCDDRFVFLWDVQTKKVIQQYKEHTGVIHQVKFHSLGNIAASCSHDRKIKLYDLRSSQVIQVYEGHDGPVKTIDFHPHTAHLISSSQDGTTKIWNTQLNRLQYTIQNPSNVTKFSREGDYFISAGVEKVINLWKTGFYDSFIEKVKGSESLALQNQDKVKYQIRNHEQRLTSTSNEDNNENNKSKLNKETGLTQGQVNQEIYYNHDKQNFESYNRQQKNIPPKTLLPLSLQRKLQQMCTQIDFITKTTQILQARVQNNGEHLKRIVQMVHLGTRESEEQN